MSTHAVLSPSKAPRYAKCPGSVREEAKYPEDRSGPAAIDGTHTHTLVEHCVNSLSDPTKMVGVKMSDHDGEFTVDQARAERAKMAIDYVLSRIAEEGFTAEVKSESRVSQEFLVGRSDMSGTVDIQIHGTDLLEIIDYKDGMNPVAVEGNEQLELYALGAISEFKTTRNVFDRFKRVRMTVIQPKLVMRGMKPITSVEMSIDEVFDLGFKYHKIGKAVDDPEAPLVPGESQCKYCKAKGNCNALSNQVMDNLGVTMSALDVAQQSADKDPNAMSDEQIREIIEAAPLIRQLLESVEKEALERLKSGKQVDGLKLVYGRGTRSWSMGESEMAERLRKMGIPKDQVYTQKLVSPAQASKLVWENRKGEKKQLTERQIKILEKDYIVKAQGKLTVAQESDSRDAVVMDAAPMFEAVETKVENESLPSWLM